jgi:isoquinoline 1-oxidoreductase beta subunit
MSRSFQPADLSRRRFIITVASAAAGLSLAAVEARAGWGGSPSATDRAGGLTANAFVHIATDGTVTVTVKHLEMGQGVVTGLPVLVAEELEVNPAAIRVVFAPADSKRYNNLFWGPSQGTGGSTATANSWEQLRKAGAAAREMLMEAASRALKVERDTCTAENGAIVHAASGRRLPYGSLVMEAAKLSPPENPPLKPASAFRLIGKEGVRRSDSRAKANGSAIYGFDLSLPGMLTALVARPPVFGVTIKRLDKKAALKVPGVEAVVGISSGFAVVGAGFWSASRGRDALGLEWTKAADPVSTDSIRRSYAELLEQPGLVARRDGDVEAALAKGARRIAAVYEVPYLAHAPMEPLSCVVRLDKGRCEIWAASQSQTSDQRLAAKAAGLDPAQVDIHTIPAGGSFGRRANFTADYIVEAVEVAKAVGAPIRLLWTREDDIGGGSYRPMFLHGLEAAVDEAGNPLAWRHRLVGQSILEGTPYAAGMIKEGIDHTSVEGAATLPYAIPNLLVDLHSPKLPVPVLWWRSVGSSHNAFATECFFDELAEAAGKDPLELRRALLADHPRHRAVLELAAEKAGWGEPLPAGHGRGIAVHESFHSFVAQVAEVSIGPGGKVTVERVVCAVDCGIAVTPDVVRAQMEGGIAFGLSAALHGQITIEGGSARQSNFHDYRILRMAEMPRVEVHIVASEEKPTGVGEPGVPPIAPAVVNAIFAATGKRIRRLPIGEQLAAL